MREREYVVLAILAIAILVFATGNEYFTDRRQVRYMRPVNPMSPGFYFEP